jgi:formylglycine-generating enzyme required for sulfatase activity
MQPRDIGVALIAAFICVGIWLISLVARERDKTIPKPAKDEVLRRFVAEFVGLTPGSGKFPAKFVMGSVTPEAPPTEKPALRVSMGYPFAISRYEVTQELYLVVMGSNPSRWVGARNAVEQVSWDEAMRFCVEGTKLLQELNLLSDDELIRLPGEAEWEYACRAGTSSAYSFGSEPAALRDFAWFKGNSRGEDPPVGQLRPNPWGLYDMHGYLWEWCLDSWHPTLEKTPTDGKAWVDAGTNEKVLRGGSWTDPPEMCRSSYRHHMPAKTRADNIGFRCVRIRLSGNP